MPALTKTLYRGNPVLGPTPVRAYVSNKALTSNLATLTTNAAHGITQVGTIVAVQGVDSTFDGTYAVNTIPSTTTFTYVKAASNVTSVAVSPVGIATFNNGVTNGFAVSSKVAVNSVATITTAATHGRSVNDIVAVTIGDTTFDTIQAQIFAVPSPTTFSYSALATTATSAAVTQGSYGTYPVLYTVPSSTNTVLTNIIITNTSSAIGTFSITAGGIVLASAVGINPNDSTVIDIKQVLTASQTIVGSASGPFISFHISGVEIS
jgi:hypothetical protein